MKLYHQLRRQWLHWCTASMLVTFALGALGGDGSETTGTTGGTEPSANGSKRDNDLEIKVTFAPIPMLRLDQGRGIINMGPLALVVQKGGKGKKGRAVLQHVEQGSLQSHKSEYNPDLRGIDLIAAQGNDRYKVIDRRKFAIGLGVAVGVSLKGASAATPFGFAGGAIPIFGRAVTAERFVSSYEVAKNLKKPHIPKNAEEVDNWAIGDSIAYRNEGGVMLFAGAGYSGAGLFLPVIIKGQWGLFIQKLTKHEYLYSIHRLGMIQASLMAGHILTGKAGPDVMAKIRKTYSFKLDLRHPEAREQFRRLMRGNLGKAQKLAHDPNAPYITPFKKQRKVDKSIGLRARFGFPIVLRKIWALKHQVGHTTDYSFADDRNVETYEHITDRFETLRHITNILKKENRHHKFKHSNRHQIYRGSARDDNSPRARYAEISWTYSNDMTKTKNLKRAMRRLKNFTGLTKQIDLQWSGKKLIGYLGIYFKLPIYRENLEYLHTLLSQEFGKDQLLLNGAKQVNSYFEELDDPNKLCSKKLVRTHCQQRYHNQTRAGLKELISNINRFFSSQKRTLKAEAKLLSEIAGNIATTPFVMQTVINSSPRHFVATYRVNGEKFRPVDMKIALARP